MDESTVIGIVGEFSDQKVIRLKMCVRFHIFYKNSKYEGGIKCL